jgi:hypothetical protein
MTPQQMERFVGTGQTRNPNSMTADEYRAQVAAREAKGYDRTFSGTALDAGVTLLKSAIGLPEAFVGLADIPTLGRAGKLLEQAGYKPKEAKQILDTYLSEAQQFANRQVKETKGFLPTVSKAIQYPSTIATTAGESLAPMLGGAGVARGILKAAPTVAPYIAGAAGEGLLGAGSAAEQIRQETEDKLLTGKQALSAIGSGVGTAAFGVAGGKLAKKLGLDDIDTLLVGGAKTSTGSKSVADFAKRATASGVSEGLFEELPQSVQEQMWMNYATDKPLMEGVPEAAGMGLVTGAAMGVGATALAGRSKENKKPAVTEETKVEPTLEPEQEVAPPVDKRQALKDAIAAKVTKLQQPTTTVPSETAVTEVPATKFTSFTPVATPEQIKEAAAILERRGVDPVDALRIATARLGGTPEVTETNAPTEEGAKDVTEPISEAGGEGPSLSAQSADNVPATAGLGEAERDGVVSTRPDVSEPAERERAEPTAVTDEEELNKKAMAEATSLPFSELSAKTKQGASAPGKIYTASYDETDTDLEGNRITTPMSEDYKVVRMDGGWTVISNADGSKPVLLPPSRAAANTDEQLVEQRNNEATFRKDTVVTPQGAKVGTQTTETVQAKEEGQEAPTAGAVSKGKRGRPKAALTEEERAEKEKARTENRADYMRGERSLPKLQAKLDEANAPIDETNIADDEGLKNAENEKRAAKRDAINALMDLEAKHRGSPLGKRAKAALADRSKISQKEHDDVLAGRKYKEQERVNKSAASVDEVEAADEGFKKATNAAQALTRIIKTGTAFQRFLAKRLRPLVAGVKFVVVEETDPLPEQLSRHQEAWGNDESRARGVYFENTATGEKTIFVRGSSAGGFQGINITTILHEALHAATQQKLELALLAVQRGFSGDAKLVRAYNDLIAVMNNAKDEYNRLSNLGQLPTDIYYLKTVSGVFSNPHEFVAYGMTDPYFQKFLMGAYGFEEESGFFTRFVDAIREMLGLATDTVNALSDLIVVTDKILSSKLTPTMKMIAKADKANAIREARVGKVYAQTPKMPQPTTAEIQETQADIEARVQRGLEQIQQSKDAEEIAKQASLLHALRDPSKILPALNRLWKFMDYKQKQAVLVPLHIDAAASWGASYVPELANTNVLMQKMAGMTQILMEAAADVSTDAMRVFAKNPGEQTKIQDVALAATLARIDPADTTATKRSAVLDKMYNGLTKDGQRVYKEMRDHLNDMTDYYMFLLEESINAEDIPADGKALIMARIKQIYEAGKRITPYFALTREGPYWLSIGKGDKREFYMRPSMTERDALAEELAKERGVPVADFVTGNNISDLRKTTYQKSDLLKDVFTAIDAVKDTDPNAKENLKDSVYELYLRTMPEGSFRGQFIERKNITGFSTDVLRGFNETSVKMALQLSKLKYSPQLRVSISAARDSAKGRPEVEPFIDDMERRVMSTLNPRERTKFDTFATIINRLSAITYLSGPSTALIQPISIMQTGAVILGARHGYAKTAFELGKMAAFWDEYAVTRTRLDGTTAWVMPTIENSKALALNEDEKWAVQQMRLRAVTSSTYASELFEFNSKSTEEVMSKTEKAKVAATAMTFGLLHSADRISREVVYLASYRLSISNGKTREQAVDQAVVDTNESQGNFADYAKSELMKAPGGRLALQFTTYALNITTLLLRNFYRMIPGLNPEGKAEAFKIFFGTLSSTSLIAGITGLPMYSAIMALLSWAWEDKERPQGLKDLDRETWFTQVYLPEILGDVTVAGYKLGDLSDLVARGALNKLTGLDFATRTGLNDMWFRDTKETKTARESLIARALERAGPGANMVLNWADAYDAFAHGDTQKGLEKVAPAIARNILVANRYEREGAKDNKGAVIAKPEAFTQWDYYGQAIGMRSAPLANAQSVNFKLMAVQKRIENERTGLLNDLDRAYRNKDMKEYVNISKDITKRFNVMYPSMHIDIDQISKSLETRAEARGKSWRGLELSEQNMPLIAEGAKASRKALKEKEAAK